MLSMLDMILPAGHALEALQRCRCSGRHAMRATSRKDATPNYCQKALSDLQKQATAHVGSSTDTFCPIDHEAHLLHHGPDLFPHV